MVHHVVLIILAVLFHVHITSGNVFEKSIERANRRMFTILRPVQPLSMRKRIVFASRKLSRSLKNMQCSKTLCFAVEGTRNQPFLLQKLFINLITAIASSDNAASFSAAQYGRKTRAISRSTPKFYQFSNQVGKSKQVGGSAINLGAALGYCGFQVRNKKTKPVVIIIGSGKFTTGFSPKVIARTVRRTTQIINVATVGSGKAFQNNLNSKMKDVIVLKTVNDLESSIKRIIPMICKKE